MANELLRMRIARMVHHAGEGHIPSSFSILEILHSLYKHVLDVRPDTLSSPDRDIFVLSKGHGAAAHYVVLHEFGFLEEKDLDHYSRPGGILGGHADSTAVPGVEFSTGSLGHGLPMAAGAALGKKIARQGGRVYVLIGDGESHEGTTWEAAQVARNLELDNLTVLVDLNDSALQLMPVDDALAKWEAFGWDAVEIEGHDEQAIAKSATNHRKDGRPKAIVARTNKGHGVGFMTGHGAWHHKVPSELELEQISLELGVLDL